VGGVSAAVSKTAAAPIERVKLLIQNQVSSSLTGKISSSLGDTDLSSIATLAFAITNLPRITSSSPGICCWMTKRGI
jgi:hypothetical protein